MPLFHQHNCTAECTDFCSVHDPVMLARVIVTDALEDVMSDEHCNRRRAAKRILWQGLEDWLWPEWWSKEEVKTVIQHVHTVLSQEAA